MTTFDFVDYMLGAAAAMGFCVIYPLSKRRDFALIGTSYLTLAIIVELFAQ